MIGRFRMIIDAKDATHVFPQRRKAPAFGKQA
jgi:hypothetical protein